MSAVLAWGCASTSPPALAGSEIEIRALAADVWLHTSYYTYPSGTRFPSNGLIVRDGDELTLIDTAWGELASVRLLDAIAAGIGLPVTKAFVSHYHGDRTAGVDALEARGVAVAATSRTVGLTMAHGLPTPDIALAGLEKPGDQIRDGRLILHFPGPAHAPDNLLVWLPDRRILFGGCIVRSLGARSAGNTAHGDLAGWRRTIDELEDRFAEIDRVVPGHGADGGIELLQHTARLLQEASQ